MTYNAAHHALRHYNKIDLHSGVEDATPHRLIQMLMDGALARVGAARGCIKQGRISEKGAQIGLAISILDGLRASLDTAKGGEIAINLDKLYEYMVRRLLEANIGNDDRLLAEVCGLMRELKDAWESIQPGANSGAAAEWQGNQAESDHVTELPGVRV